MRFSTTCLSLTKLLHLVLVNANSRVDSFVFFFSFAKYETVRNRSLFHRVSIVSTNWKKYKNTIKRVSSCFVKLKKRFVSLFCMYVPCLLTQNFVNSFKGGRFFSWKCTCWFVKLCRVYQSLRFFLTINMSRKTALAISSKHAPAIYLYTVVGYM